jgi:hypothetical protein
MSFTQPNGCIVNPRRPNLKWHSPQALANWADRGFRFSVRSTAKLIGNLPSTLGYGVSKVGRVLTFTRRRRTVMQQADIPSARPARQAANRLESAVYAGQTVAMATSAQCVCSQTVIQQPVLRQQPRHSQTPRRPLDAAALAAKHSPQDKIRAIELRNALEDLLNGSAAARKNALDALVAHGEVVGPLLAACLREESPEVVETAMEGLRQIGCDCPTDSLSDLLNSSNVELRIIALRAVQRLTDDRQRPFLERGLRDPDPRVRRRAISYVSWHNSPWAVAETIRLCDDPQPDVKWAAVEALVALRPSEAYEHLKLMLPALGPAYQRRAATLFAQRNNARDRCEAALPDQSAVQASPNESSGDAQCTETESAQVSWLNLDLCIRRIEEELHETKDATETKSNTPETLTAADNAPDRIAADCGRDGPYVNAQ